MGEGQGGGGGWGKERAYLCADRHRGEKIVVGLNFLTPPLGIAVAAWLVLQSL